MKRNIIGILVMSLSLGASLAGQDYEINSTEEVRAVVGENITLPCQTEPPKDLQSLTVEWKNNESYVHLYRNGQDDHDEQHHQYRHRTILSHEDLVKGNLSLKLLHVQLSDQGKYTCAVAKLSEKEKITRGHVSLIAQSQLIGPPQQIVAIVGDDIILPSHLEPAVDAFDMIVEWTRPDLDHRFVLQWYHGWELEHKKHPSYEGRTSLSLGKLTNGDVSLKLSEVKLSDEGKYRCFIPSLDRESIVELVVVQDYVIKSTEEVRAVVGKNVTLPCHTEPPKNLTSLTVVWKKGESFVHLYRHGQDDHDQQHQQYTNRIILSSEDLAKGNLSLKLLRVQQDDQGKYTCAVMKLSNKAMVTSGFVSLIGTSL
ncbi:CD276 antigen-like [Myripristis murdjan]|uniref:CD276 antigen-like n=1 Tax=Myripristis murdjan TaxID=586833 RepID=UPI001176489B|nr:CD276 antigen-like [Myripristis murdjan]